MTAEAKDGAARAELVDIVLYRVDAHRKDEDASMPRPDSDVEPKVELNHRVLSGDDGFVIQVRMSVDAPDVGCLMNVGAHYRATVDDSWFEDSDQVARFVQQVTLFQVWPYLRHELHSLASRLGVQPMILPLYRPNAALKTDDPATPETP